MSPWRRPSAARTSTRSIPAPWWTPRSAAPPPASHPWASPTPPSEVSALIGAVARAVDIPVGVHLVREPGTRGPGPRTRRDGRSHRPLRQWTDRRCRHGVQRRGPRRAEPCRHRRSALPGLDPTGRRGVARQRFSSTVGLLDRSDHATSHPPPVEVASVEPLFPGSCTELGLRSGCRGLADRPLPPEAARRRSAHR